MKILYYFCGEGFGHASRTVAAGRELIKEHEVIFASYGSARELVLSKGLEVVDVPSEISMVGQAGKFELSQSISQTIKQSDPLSVIKHNRLLKKVNPDLVISDSFFLPAILAKSKKIPVWMILNQTNIDSFFADKDEHIRWLGNAVKKFNYSVLSKMDKILIPDFAPPFTLSSKTLSLSSDIIDKTEYLGPLVSIGSQLNSKPKKPIIFAIVRGFSSGSNMTHKLMNVAKSLPHYEFHLISGSSSSFGKIPPNLHLYEKVDDVISMIAKSSLVICGGGHSTLMESICLGKPCLSLPYDFHFEQESNANQLQELGLGTRISQKTHELMLVDLIDSHIKDLAMHNRLQKIVHFAQALDGRIELCKLVEKFNSKRN